MMRSDVGYEVEPARLQAFAYHEICSNLIRDIYSITPEAFFQHLATLSDPARKLCGPITITFDDGHSSNIHMAAPILESFGLRAQFFITTDWISRRPECMTWNDIATLAAAGHTIGSHSATHPFLPQCSPAALERELTGSRKRLEDRIRQPVKTISMPGGRWDEAVLRACALAGYEVVYTSGPGFYRPPCLSSDLITPAVMGRFAVKSHTHLRTIAAYAEGGAAAVHLLQAGYHLRAGLRSVIGNATYQRLWSNLFRATQS